MHFVTKILQSYYKYRIKGVPENSIQVHFLFTSRFKIGIELIEISLFMANATKIANKTVFSK